MYSLLAGVDGGQAVRFLCFCMIQPNMNANKKGLFTMDDGRNLIVTFALVSSLFFLWGVCTA